MASSSASSQPQPSSTLKSAGIALLSITPFAATTTMDPRPEVKELKAEIEELKEKNRGLERKNEELKAENAKLEAENRGCNNS